MQDIAGSHTLYLDAQTLHQSGIAEALTEISPSVAKQYPEALQTGGAVAIPMGEYLANIAPNAELANQLTPIARLNPDGDTLAEVQQFHAEDNGQLKAEIESQAKAAQTAISDTKQTEAVEQDIYSQLKQVGRYDNTVNRTHAAVAANTFRVLANRLNIPIEQLYQDYKLHVNGEASNGAVLNQALAAHPPRGWKHVESGEVASELYPDGPAQAKEGAVFWTNLGDRVSEILPETKGYSHSISGYAAQHIFNHHGDEKHEKSRGQIAVTREDLARIPDIVQNYDYIRTDLKDEVGAQLVAYAKKYDDAVVLYLEGVSRKKSDFRGITMFKYPPTSDVKSKLETSFNPTQERPKRKGAYGDVSQLGDESQYYQSALTPEQQSFNATAEQYGGEQAYQQAKAEGKTELDYHQWVQVRTPEFKAWFGDWEYDLENASKVVNERTGEPLVVYHGVEGAAGFNTFKTDGKGKTAGTGAFFTDNIDAAVSYSAIYEKAPVNLSPEKAVTQDVGTSGIYHVFLNIRHPEAYNFEGKNWNAYGDNIYEYFVEDENGEVVEYFDNETDADYFMDNLDEEDASRFTLRKEFNQDLAKTTDDLAREAKESGADGVQFDNVVDNGPYNSDVKSTVWVAFDATQIKSATDNVGAFNPGNPNIYYQLDEQTNSAFAQAVDSVASGETVSNRIHIGTTPDVLRMIDIPEARVFVSGAVIEKVMKGKHKVTADALKELPKEINDPVAVMKSHTKANGYVVLTELTEHVDGVDKPVIAALHVKRTRQGYEVIDIASVYGRNKSQIQAGLDNDLMYWNKNKGLPFLNAFQLQLPSHLRSEANPSEENVKTDSDLRQYQAQKKLQQQAPVQTVTPRGAFNPDSRTISLLKGADLSTWYHELGHFYLEMNLDVVDKLMAKQQAGVELSPSEAQMVYDFNHTIMDWFGVQSLKHWQAMSFEARREYHEQFARGFEQYLMMGEAPNQALRSIFRKVRDWMVRIYKKLTALNVSLNPEVKQVFDRLVATDEEIELAQANRSMRPLFESQEQSGMSVEDFQRYQDLTAQAKAEAREQLQGKAIRDMAYIHNRVMGNSPIIGDKSGRVDDYNIKAYTE